LRAITTSKHSDRLSPTTAPGNDSWPIATFGSMIYRSKTMDNCNKAAALADFIIWSQTNANALKIAERFARQAHAWSSLSFAKANWNVPTCSGKGLWSPRAWMSSLERD
jgi:hypothetical protein